MCCDPSSWFHAGFISSPSMFVLGMPGLGKSSLADITSLDLKGVAPMSVVQLVGSVGCGVGAALVVIVAGWVALRPSCTEMPRWLNAAVLASLAVTAAATGAVAVGILL